MKKLLMVVAMMVMLAVCAGCGNKDEAVSNEYTAERYIQLYDAIMFDITRFGQTTDEIAMETLRTFYENAPVDGIKAERYWCEVLYEIDEAVTDEGYSDIYNFDILSSDDIDEWISR